MIQLANHYLGYSTNASFSNNNQIIFDIGNNSQTTYFTEDWTYKFELDFSSGETFRYAFKEALIQSGYSNNSYMSGMTDEDLSSITEAEYINALSMGNITGSDNGNSISSSSLPVNKKSL